MKICITGSYGLIGSTATRYFLSEGHQVVGIDNDTRKALLGETASTEKELYTLQKYVDYTHVTLDIRDREGINRLFKKNHFDAVIHTAGQPSHDRAKDIPIMDFEINTVGTLNLLEATRLFSPQAVFIFTSTNKVYGDGPNHIALSEGRKRYFYNHKNRNGIDESFSIDQSIHSLMGCSKVSADIYVQEYGKNYGLKTTSLRLGCVTGKSHAGVKLHGFLSYLVKCLVHNEPYQIIGYKGKQVRDQIHADDVVLAMECILNDPNKGEVFNLGGGLQNNASILELIELITKKTNQRPNLSIHETPRVGDHICYISDISKFQKRYPHWHITKNLEAITDELIQYELELPHEATEILSVPISAITYQVALNKIQEWIRRGIKNYICVAAVHLVMECQKDPELLNGVKKAGLVTPDGMPLVWLSKFFGKTQIERVYGPTLMLKICELARSKKYRVFLLGGSRGQSQKLKHRLRRRFPGIQIVGFQDTPMRPLPKKQNHAIIKQINRSRADVVFVGLGCPYQEKWIIENHSHLSSTVLIGVGAAFDFITLKAKQAPSWIQNVGFEWLYRLAQDPVRLWHRYTVVNFSFIILITQQVLEKQFRLRKLSN